MDRRIFLAAASASFSAAILSACGGGGDSAPADLNGGGGGGGGGGSALLTTLGATSGFTVFTAALIRSGLASTIETGTFTIFAPTDAAFLTAGITVDTVAATDPATLADILKQHVTRTYLKDGTFTSGDYASLKDPVALTLDANPRNVNIAGKAPGKVTLPGVDISATGIVYATSRVLTV